MLFKMRIDRSRPQYFLSTEVEINTTWRQMFSGTRGPPAETHAKWGNN